MKAVADAVGEIAGTNRPVLCLDTCVLLDVITTGNRAQVDLLSIVRRLSQTIAATPERVQLVATSLVLREWTQRIGGVQQEVLKWLTTTDSHISEIHKAWDRLGKPLPFPAAEYSKLDIVKELTDLAQSLIGSTLILKEDRECVMRAVHRVKWKKRPSHKKEIKDSIHLEHYLALSRGLQLAGHAQSRFFASTNSDDFWEDKNTPSRAHADLIPDLTAAGLTFYGTLPLALRALGIL